jgi:hypothetical protein
MKFELKVLWEETPTFLHVTVKHGDDTLGALTLPVNPAWDVAAKEARGAVAGVLLQAITAAAHRVRKT